MKNLKLLRQKKNITQVRLSVAVEVSQETISAYESGKALPSADTLIKIADFLETSVDYLLDRTDNPLPYSVNESSSSDKLVYEYSKLSNSDKEDVLWYCMQRRKKGER